MARVTCLPASRHHLRTLRGSRNLSRCRRVVQQLLPPQLSAYLDQPSREPEHRTVAVAFLRFDGTDTVLAEDGAEALTTAIDEVLRNVQQATAAHDVSFLDTDVDVDGGKILLVGGAPRSAGDDTDRLLTAVCEIVNRDARLPLRAGISQGRVFTGETGSPTRKTYSVKGDTVNLAARLAAHAESGTILMAADVLEHTRRSYAVNDAPTASLKGKSKPVPVVQLLQPLEPRRQQDTCGLARWPRRRDGGVESSHRASDQRIGLP